MQHFELDKPIPGRQGHHAHAQRICWAFVDPVFNLSQKAPLAAANLPTPSTAVDRTQRAKLVSGGGFYRTKALWI